MWVKENNPLKKMLGKDFVWNVAQRFLIKNALIVTILRNNSYARLKTQKFVFLRYMTLTISSTFPQFHSKMTLLAKKKRKQQ